MSQYPTLDEALELLRTITESEVQLAPETKVADAQIDSLDLLEFMFQAGIDSDEVLEQEDLFDEIDSMTIAQLYARLTAEPAEA